MTENEVEIIVTAKVEEAIKEFKKIVPEIQKIVQQVQSSFNKIDNKNMNNNIKQAIQTIKENIENLKKSTQDNEIKLVVNNNEAESQISQIQKVIDSLQQKINARPINISNILEKEVNKLGILLPDMCKKIKQNIGDVIPAVSNFGKDFSKGISTIFSGGIFEKLENMCHSGFNKITENLILRY